MFGVEYLIAFVKLSIDVAFAIVAAIPFRIAWNTVIPVYFADYIPTQLHNIHYWHFVGIILVFTFLGEQIQKITPNIISISQNKE